MIDKHTQSRRGVLHLLALLALLLALLASQTRAAAQPVGQPPPAWDTRLDDLHVTWEPAGECSEGCWRLISAEYMDEEQSAGLHHVFAQLRDEAGQQVAGEPVTVAWPDGEVTVTSKAAPDWADVPLWSCYFPDQGAAGPYRAFAGGIEAESDVVRGMGLPYCWHVSFRLIWQQVPPGGGGEPEPTPTSCTACAPAVWLPVMLNQR